MKVIKRNGSIEQFDQTKIFKSILGAFEDIAPEGEYIKDEIITDLTEKVVSQMDKRKNYTVEQIQDLTELTLMKEGKLDQAKAYIEYRQTHKLARNHYKEMMDIVKEKIEASNVQNQNANVDEHSFGGRLGEMSSVILKQFALDNLVSKTTKNNHINNEVYIHDLDHYALGDHNCLSIPFDKLLANGFKTRQTDVRPASSVNTAMQLVAVIFQLQSLQQFGGVSATHLDWTMVPYVRKSFYKHYKDGLKYLDNDKLEAFEHANINRAETSIDDDIYRALSYKAQDYAIDMTRREIHQAVEALYHNLNTLQSRSGNQLPFTSINYGTCTLPEGRMIIKELLNVSIEGLGKYHRTSIFPCGIFQCMKGVNRKVGDPNYDLFRLALKSTSKRLYPNYANVDWSGNAGYDRNDPKTYFSTMGCRTANGFDKNAEPGVNPQTKDGRGNICPVTIILPTLAMEAKTACRLPNETDVDAFMFLLQVKINQAKDSLIDRFNYICSQSPKAASFMYDNGTMAWYHPEEGIRSALKHGTLAIGQLGLAEALQILIGKDHTTKEGMELAKRIEQTFKDKCAQFKEQYKLNFGVYYTPAENLCHTAMKKFRQKYGEIPNVSDKDFFTNSMHVPVYHKCNAFEKIDVESQLTGYSSAGCITYIELDSGTVNNIDALEKIVNYAMDKDIPYFAINSDNNICNDCGYQETDLYDKCPRCGSNNVEQLKRVTGYLSTDWHNFNEGKQQEVEMRVKHTGVKID